MLIFSLIISSVLCTFSETSMSNNSSIAMFLYSYMYGWHIVGKDFYGFEIDFFNVWGVY